MNYYYYYWLGGMILYTWLEGTFTKSQELLTQVIIIILRKPWTLLTLGNGNIQLMRDQIALAFGNILHN